MNTKKVLLSCSILFLTSYSAMAQLYVNEDGHTLLGDTTNNSALLHVSSKTGYNYLIEDKLPTLAEFNQVRGETGLRVVNKTKSTFLNNEGTIYDLYPRDINGIVTTVESENNSVTCGIRANADCPHYYSGYHSTSANIGVWAGASGGTPGYNYGVYANLFGDEGAAILANANSNIFNKDGINVQGCWAGYFRGNVKVTGDLNASNVWTTSDYRLKKNIRQLENKGTLNNLMRMNVVKYNLKGIEEIENTIDSKSQKDSKEINYTTDDQECIGLIAQELKELYPELVKEGADGYLSVNYMGLIPLLIQSIQELNATVEEMKQNSSKESKQQSLSGEAIKLEAVLYQNNPNPFQESTAIKCYVPKEVTNAALYIYDMNGQQKDCKTIAGRGNVSVIIEGHSLKAGMYLYSLITDGSVIDTKRMILTK